MKITFRWYGDDDPVTLEKIRQIPMMTGVVSAIYSVPPGGVWPLESIMERKKHIESMGLEWEVVESVPVPESIKLGNINAKEHIENYKENIRNLAKAGIKVICYNFMPVFDWLRSTLEKQQTDGANALAYVHEEVLKMNPLTSEVSLPGWDESYSKEELKNLLDQYKNVDEDTLWENLETFLKEIIPVAEENGVYMAIHADDPPWSIFGLPRIITSEKNLEKFLNLVDNPHNGITFCTGSFGASTDNNLTKMAEKFAKRIPFVHMRNIKSTNEKDFEEVAHPSSYGSLDMYAVLKALYDGGFNGYIRPDHGRMIWGEKGRHGYGLYDRALGATYIAGLWEAISKRDHR